MKYTKDGQIYDEVNYVEIGDTIFVNPTEEQILAAGFEVYVDPEPSIEELIEKAKEYKIASLEEYDKSSDINCFYLGDVEMWLNKETRTGLKLRLDSEEIIGRTDTSLWYNNVCYTLPIETAKNMLIQLEVYASNCYDTTAKHRQNISNLSSLEDIELYDFTINYPEKLIFLV